MFTVTVEKVPAFFGPKKKKKREGSVECKKRTLNVSPHPCWREEDSAQTNPAARFCFSSGQHCSLGRGRGKKTLQQTVVLEIHPCSASKSILHKQFGEGRPVQQGRCYLGAWGIWDLVPCPVPHKLGNLGHFACRWGYSCHVPWVSRLSAKIMFLGSHSLHQLLLWCHWSWIAGAVDGNSSCFALSPP